MALTGYVINAGLAVEYLLDISTAKALTDMIGQSWTDLWSAVLLLSSCLALLGAISASRDPDPSDSLRWEALGAALLGVCSILYLVSLVWGYGLGASATTQTYAAGFGLAGIIRAGQALRDVRRITLSKRHPATADPAPLAELNTQGD